MSGAVEGAGGAVVLPPVLVPVLLVPVPVPVPVPPFVAVSIISEVVYFHLLNPCVIRMD